MIEVKTKLRRWGNSFGIVVPLNVASGGGINEGDEVVVLMKKEKNEGISELFGKIKFSRSTRQILKEVRKDFESKWIKNA
jgi:antitoxin component of MazEF toxin-antitoxin module